MRNQSMSVPMTEGPAMMPMAYTDWKKPMAVERCSSGTSRIAADMMREIADLLGVTHQMF